MKEKLIELLDDNFGYVREELAEDLVDRIIASDIVRENVHAYWIFDDFDGDGLDYQCSHCNKYSRSSHDYCPNCGACMKGVKKV